MAFTAILERPPRRLCDHVIIRRLITWSWRRKRRWVESRKSGNSPGSFVPFLLALALALAVGGPQARVDVVDCPAARDGAGGGGAGALAGMGDRRGGRRRPSRCPGASTSRWAVQLTVSSIT